MPGPVSFSRRALPRWHTRFGRYVDEVGVGAIVASLADLPRVRCTRRAVYGWLQGHEPRPERARALVALSKGRLTLDAIYSHRGELDLLRRKTTSTEEIPDDGATAHDAR